MNGTRGVLILIGLALALPLSLAAASGDERPAPYPASTVIEGITWHWDTLAQNAPGSDLWPVAWGPDDHLYAAWGDGGGFGGTNSDGRVAMGFARIEGGPEHLRGFNINGGKNPEHPASWAKSGKTDGITFVDGVLYATINLQDGKWPDVNHVLAWSADRGATWTKANWLFPRGAGNFQPAKFLTFGKGDIGAPDSLSGSVYLYGPRQSADRGSGDRLYLARVPKARIREHAGYAYFQKVDAQGTPSWTKDISQAAPIFVDLNGVTPGAVTYVPGLKRFLLTCFHVGPGQLGVFESPNPWGPWATISYDENWGGMGTDGEGLTCGFPAKWISADGLTLWSVFSVYGEGAKQGTKAHDCFNVVKASLQLRPKNDAQTSYFPPPESAGGWRKLDKPDDIRQNGQMDPAKLAALREWLLKSDDRDFAADVIHHGSIVLEVERGNSAKTDTRRVASASKAVCATVLAIASEQSQHGLTPRKMRFDDHAFDFIPWAQPLSDPRKAQITVAQLLNHTSGICPEATGAPNDGSWEYILGLSGDPRTARLSFDPGTACGYSTHALTHAALVCENVTGKPYDQFAIDSLFRPIGIEHWWFQYYDGGPQIGRHPSHGIGLSSRDLARIAYCMLHEGCWRDQQVIPKWFVEQTGAPTHTVHGEEMRFKIEAQSFSHGWQLPALMKGEGERGGHDIPADARYKPGSGGQLIAFVPRLDLVVTRQTGSSGEWPYEEYLRRACACVEP